jgi:hypothetical protein
MINAKKYGFTLLLLGLTMLNGWAIAPINNPFRAKYSNDIPLWTDSLNWTQSIDINTFIQQNETMCDSALSRAIRHLGSTGGTVYFPAGTYSFSNDIDIPSYIILRGETPTEQDARKTNFAPPTRFVFPKYEPVFSGNGTPNNTAFKVIKSTGDVQNIGIVNIDINRGRISLGSSNSERILVFGVRQNNIAQPDAGVPDMTYMNGWERFSYRHTRNIAVNANRCAAVVSCRCNDLSNNTVFPIADDSYAQPGYKAKGTFTAKKNADPATAEDDPGGATSTGITAMKYGDRCKFNYLDHYGIGISGKKMNPATFATPINQQILLQDNWVLTTMRVSYFIEAIGGIARGNVKTDIANKMQYMQPTGKGLNTNNSATFENRGLNFAGENLLIEDNIIDVQRHKFPSGYLSVDGEGILIQWQDAWGFDTSKPASESNSRMWDVTIQRNTINSYIGIYDIQVPISNLTISNNDLQGKGNILIFKKEQSYRFDKLHIENNTNISGIQIGNGSGAVYAMPGANIHVKNNTGASGATLKYPIQTVLENNVNFSIGTPYTESTMLPVILTPYYSAYNTDYLPVSSVEFSQEIEAVDLSGICIKNETGETIKPQTYIDGKKLIFGQQSASGIMQKSPELLIAAMQQTITIPAGAVQSKLNKQPNTLIEWPYRTRSFYTGLNSLKTDSQLILYPNPATDFVILKNGTSKNYSIEIHSLDGRLLKVVHATDYETVISLQNIKSGVYIVTCNSESKMLIINK